MPSAGVSKERGKVDAAIVTTLVIWLSSMRAFLQRYRRFAEGVGCELGRFGNRIGSRLRAVVAASKSGGVP